MSRKRFQDALTLNSIVVSKRTEALRRYKHNRRPSKKQSTVTLSFPFANLPEGLMCTESFDAPAW